MTENPSADNAIDALGDDAVTERSAAPEKAWWYWPKRLAYRMFRLSGELTAIVLGVVILWFYALNVLLTQQTVDISGFKPNAQLWFSEAFNGSDAQVGDMRLSWLPASNNIVFDATDVVITDRVGREIKTIPRLQTEIPLFEAAKGMFVPERLIIQGGGVTWLRTNDGNIIAGLGTPQTVGRLGPVWRGNRTSGKTSRPDFSGIKKVTITDATAYVVDDSDGLELTFRDTDLDFVSTAEVLVVDMTSELYKDSTRIPLEFRMEATPNIKSYAIDITAKGLNPAIISPKRGRFAGLKTLDTSIDLKASVMVDEERGLETADVDLKAGKGRAQLGTYLTDFDEARLKATLTADSQIMDVEEISLASSKLSFQGAGTLRELGALTDGDINTSPLFDLNFSDINLDQRPQFAAPLIINRLETTGRMDADTRRLDLKSLMADFGDYGFSLNGVLKQSRPGKWESIKLGGNSFGTLVPENLLAIWPVSFADGARRWLERSILQASLTNIAFKADLPRELLSGERLPVDDDLVVTFDVADANVRYISTMTPFTNTRGRGVVKGNSALFEAVGGNIGAAEVETVVADIPRLQPKGGDIKVSVIGTGMASDLMGIIDEKPFEFASKYGVNPSDFGGTGKVELSVTRPLLEFYDRNRIKYAVNGTFENSSAPFSLGPHKLKNGFVTMTVNDLGMTVKGPVNIGPWKADLNWQETFDFGATPTRYRVEGRMDRDTLDGFGLGFREYFDGDIGVTVDAIGMGLDLSSAQIIADLTDSTMQLGEYWSKDKGSPSQFVGQLKRRASGAILLEDMSITAPGFNVEGRIELADNLRLLDLDLTEANIEGFLDASIQAKPDELNEKLSVFLTGRYLDVSPFVTRVLQKRGDGIDVPILLTAKLDRLALNEAYIVESANMLLAHDGEGVSNARLSGRTGQGDLKLDMLTSPESAVRTVSFDVPGASEAAFAFLQLDSITGGRLQINAQLPPVGREGPINGVADIEDFKLVQAPILAQMLSVASLQGLFDTLSGGGLKFTDFTVPFSLENNELNIRNARVSGPALGMTGAGEIDFNRKTLDLDGVLVPAYTANSLLGDIPVIGDIFVGKKGEGIFALSYTVKGRFDKTQIAVNPLSALTPGFLRGIFRTKREKLPEDVISEIESVKPDAKQKD